MVREIIKDLEILQQKSEKFELGTDDHLIQDLIDTATVHSMESTGGCVGLAAPQIGVHRRAIVAMIGNKFIPFINPTIIKKSPETFIATEGCLSLDGKREVKRHKNIKVAYTTPQGKNKIQAFSGFPAQIIQHECDHLNGILI